MSALRAFAMSSPVANRTRSQLHEQELVQLREQVSKLQDAARLYEGACVGYKARIAYLEDDLVAQLKANIDRETSAKLLEERKTRSLEDQKRSLIQELNRQRAEKRSLIEELKELGLTLESSQDKVEAKDLEISGLVELCRDAMTLLEQKKGDSALKLLKKSLTASAGAAGGAAGSAGGGTASCPICFEPYDEHGRRKTALMHDDEAHTCHVVCAGCAPHFDEDGRCFCRCKTLASGPLHM